MSRGGALAAVAVEAPVGVEGGPAGVPRELDVVPEVRDRQLRARPDREDCPHLQGVGGGGGGHGGRGREIALGAEDGGMESRGGIDGQRLQFEGQGARVSQNVTMNGKHRPRSGGVWA